MAIGLFMPVFADDGRGMALDDMTYKTFMGGTMADLTKEMTDPSQGSGEMINHSDGDELTYFGKLLIVDNFRIDETNIPDDKLLLTTEMNYVGDYKNQKNIVVSRSKLYLKKVDENYVVSSDLSNDTVTLDTNKTSNPYNAHTFVYVYDGDGSNNGNVQLSSWIEVYSNGVLQGTIHLDKERLNSYNNDVNEKKVIITGFDDFKVNFTLSLISGRGDSEATLNDLVDVSSVSKAIALAENNDIIRLTKDINATEKNLAEIAEKAREKISAEDAKELILSIGYTRLSDTMNEYLDSHIRKLQKIIEGIYDKYTVTLGTMIKERDAAVTELDSYLKELGYEC